MKQSKVVINILLYKIKDGKIIKIIFNNNINKINYLKGVVVIMIIVKLHNMVYLKKNYFYF